MSNKESMPNYTRSGFVARGGEMRKDLQDRNQIKSGSNEVRGAKMEHYHAPGMGHRAESMESNKRPPEGNKIKGMGDVQRVTGGCPESMPMGKMRNEGGEKDFNRS